MSYEMQGKLIKIFDEQQVSDRFKKREFVIETDDQYPQFIKFELLQDACSLLDSYAENEIIKVSFDVRGREWNGKYFTNLKAWSLEKIGGQGGGTNNDDVPFPTADDGNFADDNSSDDLGDLPF